MKACSPQLAKAKYCTGCMACSDICRHDAIKIVERNCLPFVQIDADKCINCGLCQKACPIVTPINKNRFEDMKVYGGWGKRRANTYRCSFRGWIRRTSTEFLPFT